HSPPRRSSDLGKRRSKNPPRQALPGLVRQVAPQGSGEEKEESGPGRETLKRGAHSSGGECPRSALSRGGANAETQVSNHWRERDNLRLAAGRTTVPIAPRRR